MQIWSLKLKKDGGANGVPMGDIQKAAISYVPKTATPKCRRGAPTTSL